VSSPVAQKQQTLLAGVEPLFTRCKRWFLKARSTTSGRTGSLSGHQTPPHSLTHASGPAAHVEGAGLTARHVPQMLELDCELVQHLAAADPHRSASKTDAAMADAKDRPGITLQGEREEG
jgi:hypothetical protein